MKAKHPQEGFQEPQEKPAEDASELRVGQVEKTQKEIITWVNDTTYPARDTSGQFDGQKPLLLTDREEFERIKRATLETLKYRFNSEEGKKRHKDVPWNKVAATLHANTPALWRIHRMEEEGHEPDIYLADNKGFYVGTCSRETPTGKNGNCVYDEAAAESLRQDHSDEEFNGNAVDMATELGIDIMSPDQYFELQENGEFDLNSQCFVKTDAAMRNTGRALIGGRTVEGGSYVAKRDARAHGKLRGWRGSMMIKWAT